MKEGRELYRSGGSDRLRRSPHRFDSEKEAITPFLHPYYFVAAWVLVQ